MQVGLKLCKYFHFQAACGGSINIYATEVFLFCFCLLGIWFGAPSAGAAILVHCTNVRHKPRCSHLGSLSISEEQRRAGLLQEIKVTVCQTQNCSTHSQALTFKCWFVTNPTTLNGLKNCCECICSLSPTPTPFKRTFDAHSFACCLEHRVQCSLF